MNNLTLVHYFSLERRYTRSINLERDKDDNSALDGYILTDKALDVLGRILRGLTNKDYNNCWTLTGVYGTGKSAFCHYLSSLLSAHKTDIYQSACQIIKPILAAENELTKEYQSLINNIPQQGLFKAIAVGQREPISHTIIRALSKGLEYFKLKHKTKFQGQLHSFNDQIKAGKIIQNTAIITLIKDIITHGKTDIFFIIDELGKSLEYAVYNQGADDLYLLQQLAELETIDGHRVFILGILHQAFTEYGQRLAQVQRNEWAKIQGRFEDIPFTESTGEMMRLIGLAINHSPTTEIQQKLDEYAENFSKKLDFILSVEGLDKSSLRQVYPLHPLSALVLPTLCNRYAQNDRSLFTFLTSSEPFSLKNFLTETAFQGDILPTLKLDRIYDYFVEAAGMGLASRPNLQRWVEISDLIADAKSLDQDSMKVLKAIGILNLVTITGVTRASRDLVAIALCDLPTVEHLNYWQDKINGLLKQGLITERRQLQELRIWQGSDFNVDNELQSYIDQEQSSLVQLLTELHPLKPLVAQRHSYKTGTLRYFERHYIDGNFDLNSLNYEIPDSDGWIGYWLGENELPFIPEKTINQLPVIIITISNLPILRMIAREFAALNRLNNEAKQLQTDGVARKEVRYRLTEVEKLLNETLATAFDFNKENTKCFIAGKLVNISSNNQLNINLSAICDQVFSKSPILWNELINRRNLTAQGSKARRELITAMINGHTLPKLGLTGYGPEVTMYYSLLQETGIHQQNIAGGGNIAESLIECGFQPPMKRDNPNITDVWEAIAHFCISATEKPENLSKLYQLLSKPPYGVKEGIIPVILAAVLLYYREEVGVYQDGTFIAVLGEEHFELLLKNPERYGVKYFAIEGLRGEIFKELEAILSNNKGKDNPQVRNATLLSVVTPLYQFVKKLPRYTQQTKNLSDTALKILQSLQQTVEPDELLFSALPVACGLSPISFTSSPSQEVTQTFKNSLIKGLREINQAYENLLTHCQSLLNAAFGIENQGDKLRANLRTRGYNLKDKCVERSLKRFIQAVIDDTQNDNQWLAAVVMVVADKPAESWTDEEAIAFEVKLANIVRKFENLEAIQTEVNIQGIQEGVTARRISITRDDGEETLRMVWIDETKEKEAEELVNKILTQLKGCDRKLRETVLAKLTDRILS